MRRFIFRFAQAFILSTFAAACFSGCSGPAGTPAFLLSTPDGPVAWETTGSLGVQTDTYLDNGEKKDALLLEAGDSACIMLSSPPLQITSGDTFSVCFVLKFQQAKGIIFTARIKLYDRTGRELTDSLLYQASFGSSSHSPGLTRDWVAYTRCLVVPEAVSSAIVQMSCTPQGGKVRLGETALLEGESWMRTAAGFSIHLIENPADKYIFTAGRFIQPGTSVRPTKDEAAAGLLFFERKDLVGGWPYAEPRESDRVKVLVEKVPRRATAPFAFGVKALKNLSSVNVELCRPFSSGDGQMLNSSPVLYQARYAATRLGGSWGSEFGIRTRLLEAFEPQVLPAGMNRFFWLDVPVPENAPAGTYHSEISVRAHGHVILKIPLRLEVVPVTLPAASEHLVGLYYFGRPDDPVLMEKQIQHMAEHGINAVSLAGAFVKKQGPSGLQIDSSRAEGLDHLMRLMRKYGFFHPTALYMEGMIRTLELPQTAEKWTAEHKTLYRRAIRMMNDYARDHDWCPLMFFPVDEPPNSERKMNLARLILPILREMPGIIPYCDINSPDAILELGGYLDAIGMQFYSLSPRTMKATRDIGATTFFGLPACGSGDVGHDATFHRAVTGWFIPRSGVRGAFYWAFQVPTGDPYDELDGGRRDWCAAYPAPSPYYNWPSVELKGIRRGAEDLRLIELAQNLIEKCLGRGSTDVRDAGQRAKNKIEEILAVFADSGGPVITQLLGEFNPYAAEQWRRQLIEQVLAMQAALKQ